MKHFTLAIVLLLAISNGIFCQGVPAGMKYQAVARDLKGGILANQKISLQISLQTQGEKSAVVHYTETHEVVTSELGLFTLVIGEGKAGANAFKDVPWSTEDIWMQVAIKDKGSSNFSTISNSKLLAVPYAFHAATASQLVGMQSLASAVVNGASVDGVPAQVWSLKGNSSTTPGADNLGTTDYQDLVFITNNIERLRIAANGDISFKNNLSIDKDLTVKGNVKLNTIGGTTDIKGATNLQSTLDVTGATNLKSSLSVTNNSATTLSGSVTVGGATTLNNKLDITGVNNFNKHNTINYCK